MMTADCGKYYFDFDAYNFPLLEKRKIILPKSHYGLPLRST